MATMVPEAAKFEATLSSARSASSAAEPPTQETAHILAIATEYRQESVILQKCAKLLGYTFHYCGFGQPWVGFGTKLVRYREALAEGLDQQRIQPSDPVLLIDGWDCALVGPASEFMEKMRAPPYSEHDVPWYAGERILGPDFFKANRIDELFPEVQTPWRYPNAGAMCGRAAEVLQLTEDLLSSADGTSFPEDGNDQDRMHEHLLEVGESGGPLPLHVDSRCGIFQCLYEPSTQWTVEDVETPVPRLRNIVTQERPIVLHGNGHTGRWFMQSLWREMRFLERIGLTTADLAHLPFDGAVAPGTVPDEAVEQNWLATFEIYRIIEQQLAYARLGKTWDPWKNLREGLPVDHTT